MEIAELCKGVHCVDLGESFQTHIYLQNLASIQPRRWPRHRLLASANFGELVLGCIEAKFASNCAFESSRRDLHNAILCTALQSQCFAKFCQKYC